MIYFILVILFLLLEVDCANTNCSAINSYVQIASPPDLFPPSGTLTSAKALFGPYSYYIPPTELILLDPNTNNICVEDGITTDITNKIILIFESNGQCSNHYKAYVAQKNNATAVLLTNNDNSGEVINIIDDNSLKNTQMIMPMRSISHIDGQILQNQMTNGTNIMIEFACFTNDYPSHICVLDTDGSFWYLDGDYQRQQMTYNDHPVYKKEGYVYLVNNIYIFQHNGNGDIDWYWAITVDSNLANENAIRAKCGIAGIYEPSLCTSWNVTNKFEDNYESDNLIPFSKYNYLNISTGLCIISDLYLCIDSRQSNLAGLHGTYRQWHSQVPFWFRELDDCDTRPAFLTFNNGKFILYDSMTNWKIAMCSLPGTFTQNTWNWAKLIPNHCKDWQTIVNDSLIEQTAMDETFSIKMDTKCEDIMIIEQCNSSNISPPNKLCMDKNSVMHGFLEGEYIKTNSIGPNYGTVEYERKDKLYYENTLIDIYIWWFGEIDADRYSWWVLSDSNLTTAIALKGYVNIYGYCESKTNNPIYCNTEWKFYFVNNFHTDYAFELYSGECNIGSAIEEYIWPDYICVGLINETSPLSKKNAINTNNNDQILESKTFVGGYKINTTSTKLSDGYPHWIKPKNINWEYEDIYIYFDGFFGYWQIGNGLHVDDGSILICYQEKDYSPIDCKQWYDIIDLTLLDNIYLYECTEKDILTLKSNNNTSNVNIGEIIGIILVILFCICCIGTLYWFYKKNSIGTMQTTQTNTKSLPVKKQDSIEMMDGIRTDSNAGLTTNTVQTMKKQDFALIHPESQTPIESPEQSLGDNDLIDDNDSEKKTIIKQESNATSTSESIDDEKKNENNDDESDESQIEDDDEKKDEDEKGIDSRRMSQQMVKAMQSDLNQWTDALINDPTAAARRYSRHSTVDEKFVLKVMNNKDLNKKDDNKD
eukprot:393408_1